MNVQQLFGWLSHDQARKILRAGDPWTLLNGLSIGRKQELLAAIDPEVAPVQAGSYLGWSVRTFGRWRERGVGPACRQVGGQYLYRYSALKAWGNALKRCGIKPRSFS